MITSTYPWIIYLVEPTTVKHFCLTVFLYPKVPSSYENGTRRIYLSRKAAKLVYILSTSAKPVDSINTIRDIILPELYPLFNTNIKLREYLQK